MPQASQVTSSRQRVTARSPPAAVSRAGGGEHHGIAAVGEQVRAGHRVVRRMEAAQHGRNELAHVGGGVHLLGPRASDGDVARCALLQQELGGLDDRLGVEARAHRAALERVGDRDQGHPLVVRHVGCGRSRPARLRGDASACSPEPRTSRTGPGAPACGESGEVPRRGRRIHHRRQRRGVGGDDGVLAEAALEAQPGHAEVRVLIGELEVARVVRRFRDAPGHAAASAP